MPQQQTLVEDVKLFRNRNVKWFIQGRLLGKIYLFRDAACMFKNRKEDEWDI